jgi:hypothetical protein
LGGALCWQIVVSQQKTSITHIHEEKMPKVLQSNDGIRETVTRPIVLDISRQLMEWTGLNQIRTLFAGDEEEAAQPGSTIDSEPLNHTPSSSMWRVKVREEHRRDHLLATAVHQAEHPDIFRDPSIGVSLRPIYSPTILTFDFEYRSSDHSKARRWIDELRLKISSGRTGSRTHIVNYSYFIPKEFIPLLQHIHELREAQAGYGEDFETYLDKCFTKNVTIETTLAGTQPRYAIAEQQGRVQGQFEFEELPDDPQKENNTSAYLQAFSYRVYFDSPTGTAADYPVLVHNQLIDEKYLMLQPKDDADTFALRMPNSLNALSAFEVDRLARPNVKSGLRLPEFHEFYPVSTPRYTLQVLSILTSVEPISEANPDNRKIMNFNEIDEEWMFRPEFIDHLKYDYQYLNRYGESLVNLTVYDGSMPLHHSLFQVDADLNVVLNFEPDLRKTYYVRLSLLTDPTQMSQAARDRARNNAEGLLLIGATLCPNLVKFHLLPKTLGDSNYITRDEGEKFFDRIRKCTGSQNGGVLADHALVQWNTVMILFIEAGHVNKVKDSE